MNSVASETAGEVPMLPMPASGRTFAASRRVRLGDVDPNGRLRLDALTRYTQDVSNDDTTDADLDESTAWVVRRTIVDVHREARLGESVTLTTFCSALGRRWAERRIVVLGADGGHYEVATLWIHLDPMSGRPLGLSDQFLELYGEAAGDKTVSAKLVLPKPGSGEWSITGARPWPTRAVDFDTQGHMNNAAYWAVIEELLAERPAVVPFRSIVEYGKGIPVDGSVELELAATEDQSVRTVWWFAGEDASGHEVAAAARILPLVAQA